MHRNQRMDDLGYHGSVPLRAVGPGTAEAGGVVILALFLVMFAAGVIATGVMFMKSRTTDDTTVLRSSQVTELARSGLTEALVWFRRQPVQPVTTFAPALDTAADPPVLDTLDPDIGLVREFRITGNLFGRYEVWKQWDEDPDHERLAWRQQLQAEDVSLRRGGSAQGVSWRVSCVGYLFVRRDVNKAFNERPNHVVATEILEAEISRLGIALPGQAAVSASKGGLVNLEDKSRVDGGAAGVGIYYASGTGTPTVAPGAEVTGVQPTSPSALFDDSTNFVFGVTDAQLNTMADLYINDVANFPEVVPENTLIVVEDTDGDALNFTNGKPLKGSGIVVVRGNVGLLPGSASQFFGIMYVKGDLRLSSPSLLQGAVIVTGVLNAIGSGDQSEIIYDDSVIQRIQSARSSYDVSRAPRRRFGDSLDLTR